MQNVNRQVGKQWSQETKPDIVRQLVISNRIQFEEFFCQLLLSPEWPLADFPARPVLGFSKLLQFWCVRPIHPPAVDFKGMLSDTIREPELPRHVQRHF